MTDAAAYGGLTFEEGATLFSGGMMEGWKRLQQRQRCSCDHEYEDIDAIQIVADLAWRSLIFDWMQTADKKKNHDSGR